jgi:hypothetical protein
VLFDCLSLLEMQYCFIQKSEVFKFKHHDLLLLVTNQFAILQKIRSNLEVVKFLLKKLTLLKLAVRLKFAFIKFIAVVIKEVKFAIIVQ